jgi:hypothetical protein
VGFVTALLGRLRARAGRAGEAEALLRDALARFRTLRVSPDAFWVEALIPEVYVFDGRAEDALAESLRLIDVLGGGKLAPLVQRVRGCALAQLGQADAAAQAFEVSLMEAEERGDDFEIALTLDALEALAHRHGTVDHDRRRRRDAILVRMDIARLPAAPVDPVEIRSAAPRPALAVAGG